MKLLLAIMLATLFVLGVREHLSASKAYVADGAGKFTMTTPADTGTINADANGLQWMLRNCPRDAP